MLICFTCKESAPAETFYSYERGKGRPRCKPCRRAYERERYRVRPTVAWRDKHLRKQFGLTNDEYVRMFMSQNGRCAICKREQPSRSLAVDHDHETGRVRALLCDPCNRGLGFLQEKPEVLRAAATYLEFYK